jgi:L-ribulose-5-phosphate 3-epimerase/hexulose-6-phosphate isomerase
MGRDDARNDERLKAIGENILLKMPVGLYEKALPDALSWEERLTAAGQAGYDFVEISIDESDERLSRLDWSATERNALRQSIANSGVRIMTMCLSGHRKYPLGSHTPEIRHKSLEILFKAIDFAGDIGLRVVQVMAYDVFYETSDHETSAYFIEGLYRGAQYAGQSGVMLGLENLDKPFVENLSQALAIIREIDSPWLRLYPDIGNLAAAGYSPPAEIHLAKEQILGIHLKDALPKIIRGVPFGDGIVPFQDTFRALAATGFWGLLGVEMWGDMHANEDPIAAAKAARRFVSDLVATENWAIHRPFTLTGADTSFRKTMVTIKDTP